MRTPRMLSLIGLMVFAATVAFSAQASGAVLYSLLPGTTFSEGCVPPCLCPIWSSDQVSGTFVLGDGLSDPLFTTYPIEEIRWTVYTFDGEILHEITGSGVYRHGGEVALMQQLVLDISIDGSDLEHLDSGMVDGGWEFPTISIRNVSRGTECFDIWMDIVAAPAADPVPYFLVKSTYSEGCVPPCMCPIWMGKLVGRFTMTPSGSDWLYDYYAVNDIRWFVVGGGEVMHRITGSGIYKIGGEFALTHQMELDISIDGGEPQHLDSGVVTGGSGFPRILSIGLDRGTECYSIWVDINALQKWW